MMLMAMLILATIDGWTTGSFIMNLLQAVLWWKVDQRTRKFEKLEASLEAKAEQLIDARINHKVNELSRETSQSTHQLSLQLRELTTELRHFKERLSDGESEFEKLDGRDQKLELALKDQREWMLTTFANKKDVELLASQIDGLAAHVRGRKAAV